VENKRKGLIEDNEIDHLLQQLYGFSDEQLLRDFKEMEEDKTPRPDLEPFPDEFDRIWEDIQAERAARFAEEEKGGISEEAATVAPKPRRKKRSWKRLAVVGLAACFLTLGCCFVAVGKKSYFYREKNITESSLLFNNDSSIIIFDDQENAYETIEENFGIKPLRLNYMPEGMTFKKLEMNSRRAVLEFLYNDETIYFVQTSDKTEASNGHKTDSRGSEIVTNKWLKKEIAVKKEQINNIPNCYEAQFVHEDLFCWIFGAIEEGEFLKIVERISY